MAATHCETGFFSSRMKTIRDWISCQLISKSLLSARPLNFSGDDPLRESNQGMSTSISDHACPNPSQSMNSNHVNNASPCPQLAIGDASCPSHSNSRTDNSRDPLSKVEGLLVDYLRLILRFNLPLDNPVVAQVMSRLQLASLIEASESDIKRTGLKVERARIFAAEKEASSQTDLDFSLKILVLGKTGVGKSSTINSIFSQKFAATNAFRPSTECIQEVTRIVKGIKLTIIDTPGLFPSYTNQRCNRKILHVVKRFIRKSPPDLVLYVERLDLLRMGYSDLPLIKLISDIFGSSIWFNTVLVMTHCSSAIPEGSDGYPVSYGSFVKRCTNLVQQYILQVVPDTKLDIPVLLVDNHPKCRTNGEGEKILPNGEAWRHKFFLLSTSSKILADANKLVNLRGGLPRVQINTRSPSLPHLLSMLLRPRSTQASDGDENELGEIMNINDEDGDEYDKLPPIRILTKAQFRRLTKAQKNDYLDELEYRETLYLKKQWKEELRRRRESVEAAQRSSESYDNEEMGDSYDAAPLPDMAIPVTFDSEYPVYRYRSPIYNNKFFVRPVLHPDGWDHDINFDGINLESSVDIRKTFNCSVIGQLRKDKEEFSLHAESLMKYRDPRGRALSAGVDLQNGGKDLIYTFMGDAKLKSSKCNNAGVGLSLTLFRDMYLPGFKIEDLLKLGNRVLLHFNAGSLFGCGKAAHGGGLEATIRGIDYPVRDDGFTVGTTLISFEKEMVLGGSIQSTFRAGRGKKISTSVNLNSRKMGQISIKTSALEHTEIALAAAVISLARTVFFADRSHYVIGD